MKSQRMEIPVDLEYMYGLFLKRLVGGLAPAVIDRLELGARRTDQLEQKIKESDLPEKAVIALVALGLSVDDLVDKERLKASLRQLAGHLSDRTKQSLQSLLGKTVSVDLDGDIDSWVDRQLAVISALMVSWANEVGTELVKKGISTASAKTPIANNLARQTVEEIKERGSLTERKTFAKASTAVLALNSALVRGTSVAGGANQYVWRTSALSPTGGPDAATRDWHLNLDGSVERWDDPPVGGGTGPDDLGHPQEGVNCRCVAEVFAT